MSLIWMAIIGIIVAAISYFVMGRWVEKSIVKPVAGAEVPAQKFKDGAHFQPQNRWILMGYHWAGICGPAPIIGAITAVIFGWLPALIWFSIAILFFGGFHDYVANIVSVRTGGQSIADLAGRLLSGPAKVMFSLIAWFISILVVAAFAVIFGHVFTRMPEQPPILVYFTIIAFLIGLLMYRTKMPLGWVVLIGCVAYGFAVWLGIAWPWVASFKVWFWVIVLYAFVVAAIPVVHVETPRGALNAVLMGLGLIFLYVGVFVLGIARPEAATIKLPMWGSFFKIMPGPGPLWPIMPIVATCGAVAGFHALVSSTVTAHQLADETHSRQVVWGSMALEYLVAIWGLMAVCTIGMEVYLKTVVKSPLPLYGMGTANLMSAFGMDPRFVATIFMCVLVAFMTTSLDTIARVGRFMLAGLSGFMPSGPRQLFGNFQFSTGVTCAVGALLGATGTFMSLWPMVGIAIQSVAVLTFAIITGYLLVYKRSYTLAVISFIFLGITVAGGGVWLTYFHATLGSWHWITSTMALVVLICEIAFMVFFVRRWRLYRESNSIEEFESKLGLLAKAEG